MPQKLIVCTFFLNDYSKALFCRCDGVVMIVSGRHDILFCLCIKFPFLLQMIIGYKSSSQVDITKINVMIYEDCHIMVALSGG